MPNPYDNPSWPRSRTDEDAPRRARSSEPADFNIPRYERGLPPAAWLILILLLLLMFSLVVTIVVRVEGRASPTTAPGPPFPGRRDLDKDWRMKDDMPFREMEMERRMMEEERRKLEELKRFEEQRQRFEKKDFEK